eukprot:5933905-Prymnesium_polylepis.2
MAIAENDGGRESSGDRIFLPVSWDRHSPLVRVCEISRPHKAARPVLPGVDVYGHPRRVRDLRDGAGFQRHIARRHSDPRPKGGVVGLRDGPYLVGE